MFIENVPKVFIDSPDKLVVNMELWGVGQGGISIVSKPHLLGIVTALNSTFSNITYRLEHHPGLFTVRKGRLRDNISYLDHHIREQDYNNWYICDSVANAQTIYEYMLGAWTAAHEYERNELNRRL